MADLSELPYRPGVGIMLLSKNDDVFVGQRLDTRSEAWQMPQGGIDENETPQQAAVRELYEETGTNNVEVLAESTEWYSYDLPEYLVPKLWDGQYRGQRQKWFLIRFLGEDKEFNIHVKNAEFKSWRWASIAELMDIIVPFKRPLYQAVVDEFLPIIDSSRS